MPAGSISATAPLSHYSVRYRLPRICSGRGGFTPFRQRAAWRIEFPIEDQFVFEFGASSSALLLRGFAFGVGAAASQPPGGVLTLIASSGCGSGFQLFTTRSASAKVSSSSCAAISSRLLAASTSPCLAASANHL